MPDSAVAQTWTDDVLGFRPLPGGFAGAAFLQAAGPANDHDLGLFQSPNDPGVRRPGDVGLYHLAWEVGTFTELGEIAEKLVYPAPVSA
ncbi:VOC family protein [Rhodococcus sp. RD6.2]|uniref:VOC family protein n=1 Tax=Rhodococcus sp. RD6.2 TaxID=260936 RepID=UPI001C121B58|nr:hypothetical protein [Rhodococcus sp. RD6.2]